ncbi:MAG: DUF6069 family protein [Thermomicrobiales bacterium]
MSSITSSPFIATSGLSRAMSRHSFALVGLAASVAAALANMLVYVFGDAVVGYDPDFVYLGSAIGIGIFTFVLAVAAVLVYAVVVQRTENPVRLFTIISSVVLAVSIIPDYTYIPSEPGATTAQASILALMHVVAAGVIVWMLTTFARPRAR